MDPNLFHVDWEQIGEVLVAVVILSFVVERALAIVFEHRLFVAKFDGKGIKEPIAFAVSLFICFFWHFDIVSVVLTSESTSFFGKIITAAVIAGGSKGSVKLFHDVMGVKSKAKLAADSAAAGS